MSTKITASEEQVFRLRWLPEDDTILLSLDGHSKLLSSGQDFRSGAPTPGRFYLFFKNSIVYRFAIETQIFEVAEFGRYIAKIIIDVFLV